MGPLITDPGEFDPRGFTSFEQIQRDVEAFEKILKKFGITIERGSPLEKMAFDLLELERQRQEPEKLDPWEDIRKALRPALGLYDIVCRIVRLHAHPSFNALVDHLRLLNKGTIAQNVSAVGDPVAAKIFELLMGLVCLQAGTNLAFDGPVESYGDNPDVLVDLDGQRWGFACKLLYGTSPITLFERIEEGISQIEHSPAQVGCVVINLKNQINHDETWPLKNPAEYAAGKETPSFGAWTSIEYPRDYLRAIANQRHFELIQKNGESAVKDLFRSKKSIGGVVFFLQTATSIRLPDNRPVFSTIGVFTRMDLCGISAAQLATLNRLNDAMHHR